jgi:glycosyltransferase involved in cell wall biosynthesis
MEKITICVTTYNRLPMLKQLISSILNQTLKEFKVLIANDYVKKKITYKDLGISSTKNVLIINNKKNLGENKNMNLLLNKTKSEWLVWLSDDDLIDKNFLMILYEGTKHCENCIASYSDYKFININKKKLLLKSSNIFYKKFSNYDFLYNYAKRNIRLIGSYGLIKTRILKSINGIIPVGKSLQISSDNYSGIYPYSDNLMPIRLSKYGNISWVNSKILGIRLHKESASYSSADLKKFIICGKDFISKINHNIKKINKEKKDNILFYFIYWISCIELATLLKKQNFFYFKNIKICLNSINNNISKLNLNYKIKFIILIFFKILLFPIKYPITKIDANT